MRDAQPFLKVWPCPGSGNPEWSAIMKLIAATIFTLFALGVSARAISISLDYTDPTDPFFTNEAQSTLSKAANDVSFAITTSLNALSEDVYTGTNGASSATVDWGLTYRDPSDGTTEVTVPEFSFATDEFVIKVGSRSLGGSTLGVGGTSGASIGRLLVHFSG
jgi:hypothetical protein